MPTWCAVHQVRSSVHCVDMYTACLPRCMHTHRLPDALPYLMRCPTWCAALPGALLSTRCGAPAAEAEATRGTCGAAHVCCEGPQRWGLWDLRSSFLA